MRYRWIDPTEMPKPRGPVPMPRARHRKKTIGRALRDTARARQTDTPPGPDAESASAGLGVPLVEWHDLPPNDRETEWRSLVAWVEWLHDRYELGVSNRLPECWPQHPGLIEELRALKAWREQIYASAAPSGQAARAWHNELRTLAAAMSSFYANGCRARADHRTHQTLDAATPGAKEQWLDADPNAGIPAHLLTSGWNPNRRREGDHMVSHDEMQCHLDAGTAEALDGAAEYARHDGSWWAATAEGWLKITDSAISAELDNAKARLAELAEAAAIQERLNDH